MALPTFKNLTGYEIDTLPMFFNLTDGHAFRSWSPREEAIIEQAACLFKTTDRRMQVEVERTYLQDFSKLGRQSWCPEQMGYLMCFTASMALEIVANYLRLHQMSVTLMEPCFDNLADIFRRHRIAMSPFPDAWMEADADSFARSLETIHTEAICLVTPNNPTGMMLTESALSGAVLPRAGQAADSRQLLSLLRAARTGS